MKILQVAPVFPPHVGGLEKCVYEISKRLAERGHEVIVYTTNFPPSKNQELKDGIMVNRIPVLFTIFKVPMAIFLNHIMKEKSDLLHVHIPPIFGALSSIVFGRIKKVPVVLTYHNDTVGSGGIQRFIAKIYNVIQDRLILNKVTLITVPSRAYKNELTRRGINRNKIRVINNGIDLNRKKERVDTSEIRNRFGFREEKLVLFVGVLEKRKGIEFLIKAVPKISEKIKNVKVLVVGDGSEKKDLQNLAHDLDVDDKVFFTGYVTDEKLNALYAMADAFVLPSLYETFGLVLLEAMDHGKPIISTRTVGASELINENCNGIFVKPGDVDGLAEAIVRVLSDPVLTQKLVEKAKETVSRYSWENVIPMLIEVYKSVCKHRKEQV